MNTDRPESNLDRRPESASEVALRELEAIAAEWLARQRERLSSIT